MKRVLLTDNAASEIMRIRNDELDTFSSEKGAIADAFGELSTLINLGRDKDNESLRCCADGILNVMELLNRYNMLLNVLSEISDKHLGRYEFVESVQNIDHSHNILLDKEAELLRRVFAKRPDLVIHAPVDANAITLAEAADVLGISIEELKIMINNERKQDQQHV